MERAVREQGEAARRLEGEKLGEEFGPPIEERAGKQIVEAPIFRGTEAAPQREMFIKPPTPEQGRTFLRTLEESRAKAPKVFDEFGMRLCAARP